MAKYEARVKTAFGEIIVNFDSLEELKSSLEELDVDSASAIIHKKFDSLVEIEPRKPKDGLEEYYNFNRKNLVEVTQVPESLSKPELIAFILFAYHPESASTQSISFSSGVKNAIAYLTQTAYKKMWWKTPNGQYLLSDDGLKWVSLKILPKVKLKTGVSKEKTSEALT
jgi:hypothetical protein